MPTTIERPFRSPNPEPRRHRLTRRQCELLVESGELTGRYELIDGEIISKMGQKRPHSLAVARLNRWLFNEFGSARVQIQSPVDVSDSDNPTNEPEPDGAAFFSDSDEIRDKNPGPMDIALLVEISDSSLRFDLRTKAALYARAGIADYWVLDIAGRKLYVHREPAGGRYGLVTVYAEDEVVAPMSKPEAVVLVTNLLPPAQIRRKK